MHGRHGATVDYYRTITGEAREELREDSRTGTRLRVLRVEQVRELITCRDCWALDSVQAALREARASGRLPEA